MVLILLILFQKPNMKKMDQILKIKSLRQIKKIPVLVAWLKKQISILRLGK